MTRARKAVAIWGLAVLASAAVPAVATAGGGGHCTAEEGEGARIELEAACFAPSILYADAGERITFVNADPFAHNVAGSGWGHLESMHQGDRFSHAFKTDGVYPFACTLHPGMTGVVVVGEPPSTAVVASDEGVEPPTASARTAGGGGGPWATAGAVGLVFGAVGGVAIDRARRRRGA